MADRKIVYFDEHLKDASGQWIGGTWIGLENAKKVAQYFEERTFKRKNSGELGRWMNQTLSDHECGNTIIVFAQDTAPYDVFDDYASNALIRQYLDNDGTVLWIGDVPFFWRTKWKNGSFVRNYFRDESDTKDPWIIASPIDVLGVIPVSMPTASRFSITRRGTKYGLGMKWASLRPIIIPSHLETDRTRMSNRFFRRKGFIELAHVEGVGMPWLRPLERKGHFQKLLEFLGTSTIKAGPVEVSSDTKEKSLEFNAKYLSAWIKRFDLETEGSGFIRVWDFSPRVITERMLDEIFMLLRRYCKKKLTRNDN